MTVDEDANGGAAAIVAVGPRAQATAVSNATPAAATHSSDAWVGLGQALVRRTAFSLATPPPVTR